LSGGVNTQMSRVGFAAMNLNRSPGRATHIVPGPIVSRLPHGSITVASPSMQYAISVCAA
jgi:hypothetical protein